MSASTQLSGDASSMINAWTNFQKQLWDNCFGMSMGQTGWSPDEMFMRSFEIPEEMMDCMFRTQSEWNRMCFSCMRLGDGALPSFWADWLKQTEDIVGRWTTTQHHAAKSWFEAMRQQRPFQLSKPIDPTKRVIDAWQEAASKTWEIQCEWMKMLSTAMKPWEKVAREGIETAAETTGEAMGEAAPPQGSTSEQVTQDERAFKGRGAKPVRSA
ncbi:MAG TPA: hypothetical protein VLE49_18035 [Anaerolineales bacterium]|nr:hypothetical protein [Anaerolineales bacterium]